MIYKIWSEGYAATGESSGAMYHGEQEAETFKDAVEAFMKRENWEIERYYDPERLTYWGCKFYDNEADARKSFG